MPVGNASVWGDGVLAIATRIELIAIILAPYYASTIARFQKKCVAYLGVLIVGNSVHMCVLCLRRGKRGFLCLCGALVASVLH